MYMSCTCLSALNFGSKPYIFEIKVVLAIRFIANKKCALLYLRGQNVTLQPEP